MKLQLIDFIIIISYLLATTFIGTFLSRRASGSIGNYFLGGNKLPWYMLGLSNASGMFDISGTMWLVTLAFVYGMKSIWIPWLWPVFNQIFLMIFLSAWLRRSNVTTGAEWIETRFGRGTGSKLSHAIVVIFALISGLGFLAYGFIGLGKFMEIFIPWEVVNQYLNINIPQEFIPHLYGIAFTLFAIFYTIVGGMKSIVWADVIQYSIMALASIAIAIIGYNAISINGLTVPDGWLNPFFGSNLNIDWSKIIPEVNNKIHEDGYSLFGAFFMMMLFKGILLSIAGPAPNYDMQKILSTKSPSEAAKMSGFVSIILMPMRYLMIAGFAALGIVYYDKLNLIVNGVIDFEQILPSAINEFVPSGLLGLLLAGLLAAFMSTFSGTLNAAQAYVTNDIYLKYINPKASKNVIKYANYSVGIIVVLVSIYLGIQAKNVNQVLQLLVSALYGGYAASNVLKWYWWRFNSFGYFWGMLSGIIIAALPMIFKDLLPTLFPNFAADIRILYYFPIIFIISFITCIIASYLSMPTEINVLKSFYKNVRPWGFWKPIEKLILNENEKFVSNKNFKMDMINVLVGTIWQTSLVALPMFIIFHEFKSAILTLTVSIITSIFLKKNWYNHLNELNIKPD